MWKKWALLCLSAGLISGCHPSQCAGCQSSTVLGSAADQLDFDSAFSVDTHYDTAQGNLTVRLHLRSGYHVYALGEPVGRPLDVVILPQGGWAMKGSARIPVGNKKTLGDETSLVLEDEVIISVKLQRGQGPIHAVLKLHMCADGACDRPRNYPFVVQLP
ncbi:MAG: protein-disulfide reductase DsbD domain-containing protein [Myxococcota bacterium]